MAEFAVTDKTEIGKQAANKGHTHITADHALAFVATASQHRPLHAHLPMAVVH